MRYTKTYKAWAAMLQRCNNPNTYNYCDYGGRGIKVCERWKFFENFFEDMGEVPEGKSLDRIDVNGNYEPSNCRWATSSEQARNRRNNNFITYNGITKPLAEWAETLGISYSVLRTRLHRKWTIEEAFTTSLVRRRSKYN